MLLGVLATRSEAFQEYVRSLSSPCPIFVDPPLPSRIDDDSDLQLPGTHGTVFHWDPPIFGIPVEVLKELVGDLEKETVQRAADEGVTALELQKSGSTQPSPWSIDFDMPSPEPEVSPILNICTILSLSSLLRVV